MLLKNKSAVIYGGGGAIGGAVGRTFAREGATVFLAGRTLAKLDAVAKDISAAGGVAETAEVDALDEQAVNKHADVVAAQSGRRRHRAQRRRHPSPAGNTVRGAVLPGLRASHHSLHANAFPHGEGCRAARQDRERRTFVTDGIESRGYSAMSIYSVSKAAVRSFVRVLAAELLPMRIRANAVSPGFTKTPRLLS
jgi:NAD(P)-dependent dehydrogenase (short-subunit alcohol dehydrogenase family)